MRFGSLFSGVAGFDKGFEDAGMECVWQVELESSCNAVLENHYPAVKRYTDVTKVKAEDLSPVDLICGGSPCQDLSVAGKRAGLAGERSGLWFEFLRIVKGVKPRWVVFENVPGLLSSHGGRDFAVILHGLAECGYLSAYRILDAQFFGVAQRRRRVFLVSSLGDGRCVQVLFESESSPWNSPPSREAGARVAACVDGSPYADREAEESRLIEVSRALTACKTATGRLDPNEQEFIVMPILEAGARTNGDGYRDGDGIGKPGDPMFTLQRGKQHAVAAPLTAGMSTTKGVNPPGRRREDASEDGTGRGTPIVAATLKQRGRGATDEVMDNLQIAQPLRSNRWGGSDSHGDEGNAVHTAVGVRRLTPTECERLQGFPDGWTAGQSDSARYRMLGNAVCCDVARWIGTRILSVEESE